MIDVALQTSSVFIHNYTDMKTIFDCSVTHRTYKTRQRIASHKTNTRTLKQGCLTLVKQRQKIISRGPQQTSRDVCVRFSLFSKDLRKLNVPRALSYETSYSTFMYLYVRTVKCNS